MHFPAEFDDVRSDEEVNARCAAANAPLRVPPSRPVLGSRQAISFEPDRSAGIENLRSFLGADSISRLCRRSSRASVGRTSGDARQCAALGRKTMRGLLQALRAAFGDASAGSPATEGASARRQCAADVQSGEARAAVLGAPFAGRSCRRPACGRSRSLLCDRTAAGGQEGRRRRRSAPRRRRSVRPRYVTAVHGRSLGRLDRVPDAVRAVALAARDSGGEAGPSSAGLDVLHHQPLLHRR
jgi:hypothetical protein